MEVSNQPAWDSVIFKPCDILIQRLCPSRRRCIIRVGAYGFRNQSLKAFDCSFRAALPCNDPRPFLESHIRNARPCFASINRLCKFQGLHRTFPNANCPIACRVEVFPLKESCRKAGQRFGAWKLPYCLSYPAHRIPALPFRCRCRCLALRKSLCRLPARFRFAGFSHKVSCLECFRLRPGESPLRGACIRWPRLRKCGPPASCGVPWKRLGSPLQKRIHAARNESSLR